MSDKSLTVCEDEVSGALWSENKEGDTVCDFYFKDAEDGEIRLFNNARVNARYMTEVWDISESPHCVNVFSFDDTPAGSRAFNQYINLSDKQRQELGWNKPIPSGATVTTMPGVTFYVASSANTKEFIEKLQKDKRELLESLEAAANWIVEALHDFNIEDNGTLEEVNAAIAKATNAMNS